MYNALIHLIALTRPINTDTYIIYPDIGNFFHLLSEIH